MSPESKALLKRLKASLSTNRLDAEMEAHLSRLESEVELWQKLYYEKHRKNEALQASIKEMEAAPAEPTDADREAFIRRAGFTYGWMNLESWARRMAEKATEEIASAKQQSVTDREDLQKLQLFFDNVLKGFSEHGEISGATLQSIAEECGLMSSHPRSRYCNSNCPCEQQAKKESGTPWTCYRSTPVMDRAHEVATALRHAEEERKRCWCSTCRPVVMGDMRMVLCPDCGNKRCPKATLHSNACTNSNDLGQPGSSYSARDTSVVEPATFPPKD